MDKVPTPYFNIYPKIELCNNDAYVICSIDAIKDLKMSFQEVFIGLL